MKIFGVVTLAGGGHNGRVQRQGADVTATRRPSPIEIRELTPAETDRGARVLGRGMRDNPLHVQAFGSDPRRREETLTRMFEAEVVGEDEVLEVRNWFMLRSSKSAA